MDNIIRLGDYITEICEKTTVNNQHMVLTSSQEGIVSQDDYFNKQVASKDNTGYKVIRRGQFTYRAMSDTGRFYINRLCDYDTGIVSPAYPVFELKKNEDILPDYLQEYFHSEQFQKSIALSSTGSTRVSLKLAKIADLRIAVPSISDQRHMIIAIQHVSDLISAQNSALCKLDELVKSRFIELFGDPNGEILCWPEATIGDNCFVTKLAGFEYTNYIHYSDSGDVVMVKAQNVKNGSLNEKELSYISNEVSDSLPRSQLAPGDIVMTYVGANIGDVAIIDDRHRYHLAPNVAKIRPCADIYNPTFFMYMLMMKTDYIMRNSADTAKAALGMERIRKLSVITPPIELQNIFAAFITQIDKSKLAVKQSLEKLETLKKSLMQQYFG